MFVERPDEGMTLLYPMIPVMNLKLQVTNQIIAFTDPRVPFTDPFIPVLYPFIAIRDETHLSGQGVTEQKVIVGGLGTNNTHAAIHARK